MIFTPEIESVCNNLRAMPADWNSIISRLQDTLLHYGRINIYDHLVGLAGEQWLRASMAKLREETEGNLEIVLNPFGESASTTDFNFSYFYGNPAAFRVSDNARVAEFDFLALIDSVPTLFDISLTSKKQGARKKEHFRKIKRRLKPFVQLLGELAYVLIVPSDVYSRQNRKNSCLSQYITNEGGVVVPFYLTKREFEETLIQEIKKRESTFLMPVSSPNTGSE